MPQIKRNVILGPGGECWVYDVYDSYQNRIYTTSDKHKADEVFKRLEREHQERQAQIKAATQTAILYSALTITVIVAVAVIIVKFSPFNF